MKNQKKCTKMLPDDQKPVEVKVEANPKEAEEEKTDLVKYVQSLFDN